MTGLELNKERRLSLVKRSSSALGPMEVLIRVRASGICGTDIHIIRGESRVTLPVILGHEFGGTVTSIGEKVSNITLGDLVAVDPNIPCHSCEYCREGNIHLCEHLTAVGVDRDGGMSDECVVPSSQVYRLPSDFELKFLPLIEPLSCVLHGLDRISVRQGERVLIIGTGTIGLMHLLLLSGVAGDLAVNELNPNRLAKAVSFGARDAGNMSPGYFDAVLECSGTVGGFEKAMRSVKPGGRILVFGVTPMGDRAQISPNDIYRRELTIIGSYVNPNTFNRAIALINSGKISLSRLELKFFGLDDFREAFAASGSGTFSKVAFQFAEVD